MGTSAHLIIITLILSSCAQIVAPNGGKKDVKPPTAIKYFPDSAQLNFNSKTILIDFDEYAELKDLNSQLIISPPVEKIPDITLKNKSLTIKFDKDEKLKANTTYCINFGNAIVDITENNPIDNFKYIFSTGNFIDSAMVSGRVKFAFNHKTEKGILVMLYSNFTDSSIYKNLPDYFAKTKDDGTFQLNNVREGKYKIVALKDLNANYKYDNEAESVGFINDLVDISKKEELKIDLFQEHPKKIFLKKYIHSYYGKVVLFFNQGTDSINVNLLDNTTRGVQELLDFSKDKDTLTYWIKNYNKDTLKLQVNNGNIILDTLEIEMIKFEKAIKHPRSPLKLSLALSPSGSQSFDLNSVLKLEFTNPIASINGEPQLKIDSLPYNKKKQLVFNSNFNNILLYAWCDTFTTEDPNNPGIFIAAPTQCRFDEWKENVKYSLFIPPGTFTDIFGLKNDTIKVDFKTRELKYYGTLKLTVTMPEIKGEYIVQLMDEKETVIRENSISKSEILNYEYLHPMKYKLKIIKDENANGNWDTGNYLKNVQPEKTMYFPELIQIRSNWDADQEWKILK